MSAVLSVTDIRPRGRREMNKERTRLALERAAIELFRTRGYDAVTIDDIAAAALVSKRTFYRYFEAKEDVLFADLPQQLRAMQAALDRRPRDEPIVDAVRQAVLHFLDDYGPGGELLIERARIFMSVPGLFARMVEHHHRWELALTEHIAARLGLDPDEDLRPAIVAAASTATLRLALDRWIRSSGEPGALTDMIDNAFCSLGTMMSTGIDLRDCHPAPGSDTTV